MKEINRSIKAVQIITASCLLFLIGVIGHVEKAQAQSPRYGGILRWNVSEPYSLGYPATMTGQTDGQTSSVCLETLFRFGLKGEIVPLLATGYKADAIAKTITISLRKGVKFHDGSDFNAEVCKWNLDEFKKGKRPELKKVTSIDIIDDYTVRLNLSTFDNTIINSIANASDAGRMISKKAFEANGKEWCEQNPVGTGPFQFVERKKDVSIKWKRFDGYWDGKPYLDGIYNVRIQDPTVSMMAFKSGDVDILIPRSARDAKALENEGKYTTVIRPMGQVPALAGYANDPNSPFAKLKVRQALAYAIDTNRLAKAFGYGYWKVHNQWAVPGTWGYNHDIKGYPYNPEKAKQLLAEAGYPNGFKTTLHFYNFGQEYVDEMTAIQGFLKAVGIDGTLNGLQRPGFAEMASLGKGWEGVLRLQGYSSPDPLVKYAGIAGRQEFVGIYLSSEFVSLFNRATMAPDFETKQRLVHQLMKQSVDDCMAAHLYVKMAPIIKTKKLHDDLFGEVLYSYLSPKAWLEE
ncbi:MAG: ABC transporter substrate-binding protein [Deltaproteobacteria bacterium]|nr:ABC transporter substrate-binding protein [Deltaproteobacteria bacterium]